jgi:hypothetical protein
VATLNAITDRLQTSSSRLDPSGSKFLVHSYAKHLVRQMLLRDYGLDFRVEEGDKCLRQSTVPADVVEEIDAVVEQLVLFAECCAHVRPSCSQIGLITPFFEAIAAAVSPSSGWFTSYLVDFWDPAVMIYQYYTQCLGRASDDSKHHIPYEGAPAALIRHIPTQGTEVLARRLSVDIHIAIPRAISDPGEQAAMIRAAKDLARKNGLTVRKPAMARWEGRGCSSAWVDLDHSQSSSWLYKGSVVKKGWKVCTQCGWCTRSSRGRASVFPPGGARAQHRIEFYLGGGFGCFGDVL